MSIKHGLLALLREGPKYGYQLRGEFEAATGATWPLNIGQVYTTLTRLERDGLVRAASGEAEVDGRSMYEITDAGQAELAKWFETPVTRESRPRDELAIKLALALSVPGVDVSAVVQRQRMSTMQSLQELTRLKRGGGEISWLLVLESMIFGAEAEIRWLDHCEAMLLRHRAAGTTRAAKPNTTDVPDQQEHHTGAKK
ncbi:PadR family transcriptional regulator [Kribbella sp. NPDC050241]|uniref:PadR family transcriptional regulator n=1 Tax=Kribbella sp. NPDC050241 TaxID=3364115 RepID=UPI00378D24A3